LAALIVVMGGAAAILAGAGGGDSPPVLPKSAIRVEVSGAPGGIRIPSGFVGLSIEYSSLEAYAGRDPRALNLTFIRLIHDLAPGASPVIRIGGDTTDWAWWSTGAAIKPPWARFVLTPRWIAVARALALATGARLIPGINFEADSRELAGAESRALLKGLGRKLIAAFELGNEPEVYGEIGWYANSAGIGVLGRPASYGFRAYLADYRAISSALPQGAPLAGPALALTWPLTIAGRFLSANPRVRLFTFHFYPLKRCYNARSSPTYPTLAPPRAAVIGTAGRRGSGGRRGSRPRDQSPDR
jgi:hypothetical protein